MHPYDLLPAPCALPICRLCTRQAYLRWKKLSPIHPSVADAFEKKLVQAVQDTRVEAELLLSAPLLLLGLVTM